MVRYLLVLAQSHLLANHPVCQLNISYEFRIEPRTILKNVMRAFVSIHSVLYYAWVLKFSS